MEDWSRGPTIGRGSSATVSLAVSASGDIFAVKSADLSSSSSLRKEQSFLSKLSCQYIVKYVGSNVTQECNKMFYNLLMEYVPGGTLHEAIKRCEGRLDESSIRSYTCQILKGLEYLHSQGIVHCDVKSENVLIGETGAKIADLGCAKLVSGVATSAFSGTPAFMAPEVARGEEQAFAADVWALGCTVIEMATGSSPWTEMKDAVAAMYRIGFSADLPEIPSWLSEKAKDFLANCLRRDPKERWTVQELLEHPFLDETVKFHCPKEANMSNSPSTVLDQGFWDSCEDSRSHFYQIDHDDPLSDSSDSSNSPVDRIRNLMLSTFSSFPDWSSNDHDWITLRSNEMEQTHRRHKEIQVIGDFESRSEALEMIPDSYYEELPRSILDEDVMLLESYSENRTRCRSTGRDVVLACDIVVPNIVIENIRFQTLNRSSILSDASFWIQTIVHVTLLPFRYILTLGNAPNLIYQILNANFAS